MSKKTQKKRQLNVVLGSLLVGTVSAQGGRFPTTTSTSTTTPGTSTTMPSTSTTTSGTSTTTPSTSPTTSSTSTTTSSIFETIRSTSTTEAASSFATTVFNVFTTNVISTTVAALTTQASTTTPLLPGGTEEEKSAGSSSTLLPVYVVLGMGAAMLAAGLALWKLRKSKVSLVSSMERNAEEGVMYHPWADNLSHSSLPGALALPSDSDNEWDEEKYDIKEGALNIKSGHDWSAYDANIPSDSASQGPSLKSAQPSKTDADGYLVPSTSLSDSSAQNVGYYVTPDNTPSDYVQLDSNPDPVETDVDAVYQAPKSTNGAGSKLRLFNIVAPVQGTTEGNVDQQRDVDYDEGQIAEYAYRFPPKQQ